MIDGMGDSGTFEEELSRAQEPLYLALAQAVDGGERVAHIVFVVGHDGDVCEFGRRGCGDVLKWLSCCGAEEVRVVASAVGGCGGEESPQGKSYRSKVETYERENR